MLITVGGKLTISLNLSWPQNNLTRLRKFIPQLPCWDKYTVQVYLFIYQY